MGRTGKLVIVGVVVLVLALGGGYLLFASRTSDSPPPAALDAAPSTTAGQATGMTGADLRNLANEAALLATREGKNKIDRVDFHRATDRVLMGPKREEILTPEGKRRTAYHEAGHALVSWLEPHADPPQKVSIIPRGRGLGVTFFAPDEDRHHHGFDFCMARLVARV